MRFKKQLGYFQGLFSAALFAGLASRGAPCGGGCEHRPPKTLVLAPQWDAGAIEGGGGDLPIELCEKLCGQSSKQNSPYVPALTGCRLVPSDGGTAVACDFGEWLACSGGG